MLALYIYFWSQYKYQLPNIRKFLETYGAMWKFDIPVRENEENEHNQTQKELQNWRFLKFWVFEQACLYLLLGAKHL